DLRELSGRKRLGLTAALLVEGGRDVADADDANQTVIVDHRQMADVVSVHQVTSMFESIGRAARHQLMHANQLRDLQIDAGRAVYGNRANDVALGEHAYRGIAFSPD